MRRYTKEQKEYLRSIVSGHSYGEIAEMFNERFEPAITASQVNSFIGNNRLNTGRTGRFEKGHIPFNKGLKGMGGWEPTQFKEGNVPHNYKPVGTERVNADGYTEIKVADPKTWKAKHVIVWEEANGPVPKGYVVIFGDGNRQNFDVDNLLLISRRQLVMMNKNGLISDNAELTETGRIMADIYLKIGERRKGK